MLSQYELIETLGVGGMGVVVRAEDAALSRPVALKFLSGKSFGDEQLRARFLREARVIASLNHPNVCTIHAVGEVAEGEETTLGTGETIAVGTPFLALEFIEGRTLRDVLAEDGRLPIDEVLRVAIAIAEGLAAAHAKGLVHRDLKPDNVMVTHDRQVKILDFGLAKPTTASRDSDQDQIMTRAAEESAKLTVQGMIVGTISYMSPEQAQGKELDATTDVFSFGVLLHEMIAGKRPFEGDTAAATMAKIIESAPTPLAGTRPDLPPEAVRIVERCLRKSPDDRFHDVRDLAVALRDLRREGTTGPTPAVTQTQPAAGPASRGLLAAAGVLVLGSVGVAAWALGKGESPPETGDQRDDVRPVAPEIPTFHAPKLTQVTYEGNAAFAAISPNGGSIAYASVASWTPPDYSLRVRDIATGATLAIAGGVWFNQPSWSPDGSQLSVSMTGEERVSGVFSRLGGEMRRFPDDVDGPTAWAPSGDRIATFRLSPDGSELVALDARSFGVTSLAASLIEGVHTHIDWSHDGRRLLATSWKPDQSGNAIWTYDFETGETRELGEFRSAAHGAHWSPEGDAIYFVQAPRGSPNAVWRAEFDPKRGVLVGEPRIVLPNYRGKAHLSISADGHKLVYGDIVPTVNVWRASLEKVPEGEPLAATTVTNGTGMRWQAMTSPDESHVTYRMGEGDGAPIFISRTDGTETRQFTFPSERESHSGATWSADGERLYFASFADGVVTVKSAGRSGGGTTTHGTVDWRPNHSSLVVLADGRLCGPAPAPFDTFIAFDPETGESERLIESPPGETVSFVEVSPDGGTIAYRRADKDFSAERSGIWICDLETREERRISDLNLHVCGFSADGAAIIAKEHLRDSLQTIWRLPLDGGEARALGILPHQSKSPMNVRCSGDRRSLVMILGEGTLDIWLAEDWDPTRPAGKK